MRLVPASLSGRAPGVPQPLRAARPRCGRLVVCQNVSRTRGCTGPSSTIRSSLPSTMTTATSQHGSDSSSSLTRPIQHPPISLRVVSVPLSRPWSRPVSWMSPVGGIASTDWTLSGPNGRQPLPGPDPSESQLGPVWVADGSLGLGRDKGLEDYTRRMSEGAGVTPRVVVR